MKLIDLEFELSLATFDWIDQDKDVQDIPYFSYTTMQWFVVQYYKDAKGEINMRYWVN